MDVQRLRTFRAVVETGSVRAAAQSLDYSPASVSQQLAQLQRETGVLLFTRVGRGIEPTSAARALASRLDGLFAEVADLDGFVAGLRAGRTATFRMAYFSSLGAAWMPAVMAGLTQRFPTVRFDLHVHEDFEPAARPRPDLQLVATPEPMPAPDGHRTVPLAVDAYVVAVHQDHPLTQSGGPVRMGQLRGESWVDTNAGRGSCRRIALDACAAAGFRPVLNVQAQDYATALALVAAGVGITVLPMIGALVLPPEVVTLPLVDPTPVRHVAAVVPAGTEGLPLTRAALELLHEAAGTSPA